MFGLNAYDTIHLDVTDEQRSYIVLVLAEMIAKLLCNQQAETVPKVVSFRIYEVLLHRPLDVEHLQGAADRAFHEAQVMERPQKGIPIERKQRHQAVLAALKASAHAAYAIVDLYEADLASSRPDIDPEHMSPAAAVEIVDSCTEAAMQQLVVAVEYASAAMATFIADDLCGKIERALNPEGH